MNIYWYWPHPHRYELPLALATMQEDDHLTVESFATWEGVPVSTPIRSYRALRDLPEPRTAKERSLRWVGSRAWTYVERARRRHHAVARDPYDVCHIFSLNYFTDPWSLRRLARRVPLVCTVHDVVPHQPRVPATLERKMLWRLYRYAGTLLVAHEHLRGRLIGEFGVEPGRIEIVPLPIREIERRDRVSGQDSIVLFFGKFRRNKGIEILLEAINDLSRDLPQARFHFAGRGVDELERLVADAARKNPQITAEIGFISDERRDELFARAELVVLPYTSFASQSGVLGDAYAFQVPLVATDVGALGDSIRADRTGWVVAPGDAGALAGAIKEAIHDPPARARASAAAAAASEERTVAQIGRRIREIYDRVVQAHRRQTVG